MEFSGKVTNHQAVSFKAQSLNERMNFSDEGTNHQGQSFTAPDVNQIKEKDVKASSCVIDYSSPSAITHLLNKIDCGKYGSVTKEMEALIAKRMEMLASLVLTTPSLMKAVVRSETNQEIQDDELAILPYGQFGESNFIDLEEETADNKAVPPPPAQPIVILDDSDDEGHTAQDHKEQTPSYPFEEIFLPMPTVNIYQNSMDETASGRKSRKRVHLSPEAEVKKDPGVYVGVDDDHQPTEAVDDGLGDIWTEMSMALECAKDVIEDPIDSAENYSSGESSSEEMEGCDHSFILKDDIGYVCRVCGVIDRKIENIFEFQYNKVKRTRTYMSESRNHKNRDFAGIDELDILRDLEISDISAHPRHMKQMKPHQVEGFSFLVRNLVSDNPGGCILAHAPGSGKTFMIISFMQSFLAKYPDAKALVVLPKGILPTWKKEFQTWQVEDIPLLDFYTAKADSRVQQLEILKQWVAQKSILFLGYRQFSIIVCNTDTSHVATSCQQILLKAPSILILDEGHTPRNENTDVLNSLAQVQTPRKVVLSGTLYQNHVKEVFNILNLVRPKFLKLDTSRIVVKRIMSRVHIPGFRRQTKSGQDGVFYDLVEQTLQDDTDEKRRKTVIQDLREMTRDILHYYKGDFLDELPGLVDFTVVLNLSKKQRDEVQKLRKRPVRKFELAAEGSSIYLHPRLNTFSKISTTTDSMMDDLVEKIDVREGMKAKFLLNLLNLCMSAGEKLLVFSQYLIPLKFLERLVVKMKNWSLGKELFVISGDTGTDDREWAMERFNNSPDAKILFGSIRACGEGISLVGASRIVILDVPLNPSVTRQAIGRAFRPGQKRKVYAYRLVAADSPEEDDHNMCFEKELISKMWFEWNEYSGFRDFKIENVDVKESGDRFLETPILAEDVKALYKR
ncbi:hypothetical protein MLD38_023025 [Melastoma candidum]|uniref:Uncharacterized protein n=1 Tax=Melastoma candidum TaxID=119954 RepID=A0ACB9QUC6_9MYRT|nr:hypothetical protein MLD38_023025 [Melastoma candidum]